MPARQPVVEIDRLGNTLHDYTIIDPAFENLIIGHAQLQRLWTGDRWTEGPASRAVKIDDVVLINRRAKPKV